MKFYFGVKVGYGSEYRSVPEQVCEFFEGGVVAVTSVVVFCTGLLGSICGPKLLNVSRVNDPMAVGFALGAASHGIGTSRAVEIGALEGAMAGLAMALTGFVTALLLPLVL